jgi:hypothetical protein
MLLVKNAVRDVLTKKIARYNNSYLLYMRKERVSSVNTSPNVGALFNMGFTKPCKMGTEKQFGTEIS